MTLRRYARIGGFRPSVPSSRTVFRMAFDRSDIDFIYEIAQRVGRPERADRLRRELTEILEYVERSPVDRSAREVRNADIELPSVIPDSPNELS